MILGKYEDIEILNYYNISHITDAKKVGAYEQIKGLSKPLTKEIVDGFGSLQLHRREFPEPLPDFTKFVLAEEAVLTDVVSFKYLSMAAGFLCSDKCRDVLTRFEVGDSRFYESKILDYSSEHKYQFCHVIESSDYIDFSDSLFGKTTLLGRSKGDPLKVYSKEEYHNTNFHIQQNEPGMKLAQLEIALLREIDLIRLPGSPLLFVSEKLKEELEREGVSGIKFTPSKVDIKLSKA